VFVGDSISAVQRAVAVFLSAKAADDEINDVDPDWVAEFPLPADADDTAVGEWLDALQAQTTDAWLTLYGTGRLPDGIGTYTDVRTGTIARCVDLACDRVGKYAVFDGRPICPPGHAGPPLDLDPEHRAAAADVLAVEGLPG
jgi:hypothetical protein